MPKPQSDQPVQLTFLHTSDWHSRLLPYDLQLAATDRRLIQNYAPNSPILAPGQSLVQIGGLARMATLIKRERARTDNVIWVDSGDCFQGAPIFNAFNGEVETRAMSRLGADAVVIGNHEFDKGLDNLAHQLETWGSYPILAANYRWAVDRKGAQTMARLSRPYVIVQRGGLKIAIIGMANLSSLNSIGEGTNSLGVQPLDEIDTVQFYIDFLAGQVDLIGITSHMGLTGHDERLEDYEVIAGTVGLDFVFGGHLHVVLDPPQVRFDKAGRPVVLTHSGAFMKFLGRLDVVVEDSKDPYFGYEITSHRYNLFPIDSSVPDDPATLAFLEPYIIELNRKFDLKRIIAYAPKLVPRFGREKAGSELGNIAAESMADRRGVQADFALTNTLGIRTDIIRGPITQDQMFNVFPFDNFITPLDMSGGEICEMMTFVARRSAGRGCAPQAQFSDRVHLKMNCVVDRPECSFASEVAFRNQSLYSDCIDRGDRSKSECDVLAREPMERDRFYRVAVNDYIANGGSGFRVLKFNNSKNPTNISIRDAVSDRFQTYPTCVDLCVDECVEVGANEDKTAVECANEIASRPLVASSCEALTDCVSDVGNYRQQFCDGREELDPRTFCAGFRAGVKNLDPEDHPIIRPTLAYCGTVDRARPDGDATPLEDDCFLVNQVVVGAVQPPACEANADCISGRCDTEASQCIQTFEDGVKSITAFLESRGIPPLSDKCECRLDGLVDADAQCRQLACVIGEADDRMETKLFEQYSDAKEAFAEVSDLCAEQAFASDCDAEDLVGIGNDGEPN